MSGVGTKEWEAALKQESAPKGAFCLADSSRPSDRSLHPPRSVVNRLSEAMTDHYADAVFSEPGRCWRTVHDGKGSGRPTFCEEPVAWVGTTRLKGGRRIPVWSCEGHREGVEGAEVA